jgi:ribosomal protein S27AE
LESANIFSVQIFHSHKAPFAQHRLNREKGRARYLLSIGIVNLHGSDAHNMKHLHLKKCPLCGQALKKSKNRLLCDRCQIEIKGDTVHLNSALPPEWDKA